MSGAEGALRRAGCAVLEFSTRISPEEVRPWGEALQGELLEVRSSLESLSWALGGALVLWRETLLWALMGGATARLRRAMLRGPFMQQEEIMKKLYIWIGPIMFAGALALFFSPVFREGMGATAHGLRAAATQSVISDGKMHQLYEKGLRTDDAELLAFVALRNDWRVDQQFTLLAAQRAVQLDPRLVWIFAQVLPARIKDATETSLRQLSAAYPQNAMPHLLLAQWYARHNGDPEDTPPGNDRLAADSDSMREMKAAFRSPQYDSFALADLQLQRRVAQREGLIDPVVLSSSLWTSAWVPMVRLTKARQIELSEAQRALQAGDKRSAVERLWMLARFARVMRDGSFSDFERLNAATTLMLADQALAPVLRSSGEFHEAEAFDAEARQLQPYQSRLEARSNVELLSRQQIWQANIVVALFLLFCVSLTAALLGWITILAHKRAAGSVPTVLMSILAFWSGVLFYLTYRPMHDVYVYFVTNGFTPHMDVFPLYVFGGLIWPFAKLLSNAQSDLASLGWSLLMFSSVIAGAWYLLAHRRRSSHAVEAA